MSKYILSNQINLPDHIMHNIETQKNKTHILFPLLVKKAKKKILMEDSLKNYEDFLY